jgi:hypothetical protein
MDLTAWQRICNRVLGRVVKKRARGDKELADNLVKGSMKMMPEVYLATAIMTTMAITLICWGFVSLFFIPDIGIIKTLSTQPSQEMAVMNLHTKCSLLRSRQSLWLSEASSFHLAHTSTTKAEQSEKLTAEVQ